MGGGAGGRVALGRAKFAVAKEPKNSIMNSKFISE
jgi:hypothetical protein